QLSASETHIDLSAGELPAHVGGIGLEHLWVAASQRHHEGAIGIEELARVGRAIPGSLERQRQMALIVPEHLVAVAAPTLGGWDGLLEIQLMLEINAQV